jgi:hypothetical protein
MKDDSGRNPGEVLRGEPSVFARGSQFRPSRFSPARGLWGDALFIHRFLGVLAVKHSLHADRHEDCGLDQSVVDRRSCASASRTLVSMPMIRRPQGVSG